MNSLDSKWATFKKQASGDYVPEEDEEGASRRNFGGSPSRMRSQIKTMIMVLRWHIFVLDLKTVGIHEPPYSRSQSFSTSERCNSSYSKASQKTGQRGI